ncbi:MAG TPA: hypothetical protein P5550_09860 [Bacteroidales bacterium]|nr:hypothetical protein [Bacteroidales bacterium]HRZ76378.1 hypothetical protein [Bacteroidales bacterium]
MGHHPTDESNLTPAERHYADFMRRGDDFYAIDLFVRAREMYEKALEHLPGDENALRKIAQCRDNVSHDTRKVLIILGVAALVVLAFLIL